MKRIVVTPAGRRRYMEVLARHMRAQRNSYDEWHIWQNTNNEDDINFFKTLDAQIVVPPDSQPHEGSWNIYRFYMNDGADPGALYVRLDDDVVWLQPDFFDSMFQFRLQNPEPFLVSANVINNAICSHIHHRLGLLPRCGYGCLCATGWHDSGFAELVHRAFLQRDYSDYWFPRWCMWPGERISVNAISWRGDVFAAFGGAVGRDEEPWLTEYGTQRYGALVINGRAVCAHFAFQPQRAHLDATDLLEQYAARAAHFEL
jgi:hypothetical protein